MLSQVVATGWRPRLTGVVHWWTCWSLQAVATTVDGGDQLASNLALLLLPLTLTDPRRWHWDDTGAAVVSTGVGRRIVAASGFLMCRIQVAGVYFHASTGKMAVGEWADGTALYYWFTDPLFGGPGWMAGPMRWLLDSGPLLALATWSSMLLELALFAALVMPRRARAVLLVAGIAFHAAIAAVHGLITFSLVMVAALILYLRPWDAPLDVVRRCASFVGDRAYVKPRHGPPEPDLAGGDVRRRAGDVPFGA
ncbi:MAG: sporulation-delaying protein SdpB family protein [Acidobacteriota bacterium]